MDGKASTLNRSGDWNLYYECQCSGLRFEIWSTTPFILSVLGAALLLVLSNRRTGVHVSIEESHLLKPVARWISFS